MNNLLEINNLIVSFENPSGELAAVKGVSLSLNAHETLALVGESGCGKTVLCKSMLKILCGSGRIRQGEILLRGKDLTLAGEAQMQRCRGGEIAMVFQDPMTSLDPAFSVGAQIAEVLRIHKGLSKSDAKRRALELMQMVQIPQADKRYDQRPGQFSGGMRQRIAIAIALAGEPELLLADEPTTALDEEAQQKILRLLKKIQRETGVAILFITHDLSLVEDVADRVAIMKDGVIVEEGKVADVFAAPSHAYTRKLLGFLDYKKGRGHHHRERPGSRHADSVKPLPPAEQGLAEKPLLSVKHLCKSFAVGKVYQHVVLDDFNMDIYRGEIVGLIGRSGCGKSTLARCLMGIEPFESGVIEIGGAVKAVGTVSRSGSFDALRTADAAGAFEHGDLMRIPADAGVKINTAVNIQMIFQDSQSAFNDRMTIGEIIAEPLRIAAGKRRRLGRMAGRFAKTETATQSHDTAAQAICTAAHRQDAVAQAMRAVELPAHLASRKPYELSGGQRQRTAIARALITRPDFIIADEPLTGLDVSAQAQIVHLFKKLAVENDLTILFIAHDLPMVNHISSRVIRMS